MGEATRQHLALVVEGLGRHVHIEGLQPRVVGHGAGDLGRGGIGLLHVPGHAKVLHALRMGEARNEESDYEEGEREAAEALASHEGPTIAPRLRTIKNDDCS